MGWHTVRNKHLNNPRWVDIPLETNIFNTTGRYIYKCSCLYNWVFLIFPSVAFIVSISGICHLLKVRTQLNYLPYNQSFQSLYSFYAIVLVLNINAFSAIFLYEFWSYVIFIFNLQTNFLFSAFLSVFVIIMSVFLINFLFLFILFFRMNLRGKCR